NTIVEKYLPNSIGLELFSNLDVQIQNRIADQLSEVLNPYTCDLNDIISIRLALLNNFSKFRDLYNESLLKVFGKGFVEGLTFGFIGDVEGEEKFVNDYLQDLETYVNRVNNLAKIFDSSIIPLHSRIYDDLINIS